LIKKIIFICVLFFCFSVDSIASGSLLEGFFEEQAEQAEKAAAAQAAAAQAAAVQAAAAQAAAAQAAAAQAAATQAEALKPVKTSSEKNLDDNIEVHIKASCARSVVRPLFKRETKPSYFFTELGSVINQSSLREFFNITNNKYSETCDKFYRKYLSKVFHKVVVIAYNPKDIKEATSYWGFSYNGLSRLDIERSGIKACEASIDKKPLHECSILFSNNQIINKHYLELARLEAL